MKHIAVWLVLFLFCSSRIITHKYQISWCIKQALLNNCPKYHHNAEIDIKWTCVLFYLSTNIPACTACTMLRNLGFSSERRTGRRTLWVKVDASQSVTSEGTPSDCSCWRSSSDSKHCLRETMHKHTNTQTVIVRQTVWKHSHRWVLD